MKIFWHIWKREFTAYFTSPIAYVVATVFLVITGILFYSNVDIYSRLSFGMFQNPYFTRSLNLIDDLFRPLFGNIAVILLFLLPALTMRSFSEEKRSGTIELLFSYPIRDMHVILGKYFAAFSFLLVIVILTLFYPAFLEYTSDPEWGPMISAYLGFLLFGASFIAIGIFASSSTENQIVAALLAFGLNLVFWIIGWIVPADEGMTAEILKYLSIIEHYDPMTKGILNTSDIIFFISLSTLFLFLTSRVLLSKKWRG